MNPDVALPPIAPDALEKPGVRMRDDVEFPTVWGYDPIELHDRFWASQGVQIVRQGRSVDLAGEAQLYLLCEASDLVLFRLRPLYDHLSFLKPRVLFVGLQDQRHLGYAEIAHHDDEEEFVSFERVERVDSRRAQIALTGDAELARDWSAQADSTTCWSDFASQFLTVECYSTTVAGRLHDAESRRDAMRCVEDLLETWREPDLLSPRVRHLNEQVWIHQDSEIHEDVRFVGPVWVGAGRQLGEGVDVVGPAVLWDHPESRPARTPVHWRPTPSGDTSFKRPPIQLPGAVKLMGKRAFDIVFALGILSVTLPFYPLVMLLIFLQDGRPFFFAHRRQTLGGRTFPCLKFRTMRKNAEELKKRLMAQNQVDGPQFFIENDPRLIRGGKLLRKFKIDELPQFINVLLGDMSVVGPRPSPEAENRYCPAWKEARLSVRAGITGLWQVRRTREPGLDFQEWIRHDIDYVERMSWRLDLWILWKTIATTLRGG